MTPDLINIKDLEQKLYEFSPIDRMFGATTGVTIDLAINALATAQNGDFSQLFSLYEMLETGDARIAGLLSTRREALASLDYVVSSSAKDVALAEEATQFVSQCIEQLKWKSFIKRAIDGRVYGVQMFEISWKQDAGRVVPTQITPISKSRYGMNMFTGATDVPKGRLLFKTAPIAGKWLDATAHTGNLIYLTDRDEPGYYDLGGVMRTILRWYIVKFVLIRNWAQYAEKYGHPVTTITVDKATYDKSKTELINLVKSVGINRYGIFFDGMKVETQSVASSQNVDTFQSLIDMANKEIAIAVVGQNLTSDVTGGSLAAADVHLDIFQTLTKGDAELVDETVNVQFIDPLVRLNFPTLKYEDYPRYSTVIPNREDPVAKLERFSKLAPIGKQFAYEQAGVPMPAEDEETIGGSDSLLSLIERGSA